MPRASPADGFVWRAAARPDRARLLGAIAIAVSCGGLGVVAGRWSAQVVPADPGRRTAALIEAVAKETRAKLTQLDSTTASSRAVAPVGRPPEPAAAPGGGEAPEAPAALARDGEARDGEARDGEARDGEARDGETRDGETREAARRSTTAAATGEAQGEELPAAPAPALPPSPRSQQPPTIDARPAAPNYQALRDYVLRR
jgi:hypothetical protein